MLQEHYEGLSKYADEVAERLLAIGSSADGRANTIVRTSGIPESPGGFLDDAQVIVWFTTAYKKTGEEIRAGIKDTNEPDPTTANLLQEVELGIDKYQWQMRAQVQRTATDPNNGWDLNDNKPVDLPSRMPPAGPEADWRRRGASVSSLCGPGAEPNRTTASPSEYGKQLVARILPAVLLYELDSAAAFNFACFNGRRLTDDDMDVALTLATNTALGDGVAPDDSRTRAEFPYFGDPYTGAEQVGVTPAGGYVKR
jgi:hypothetical protein